MQLEAEPQSEAQLPPPNEPPTAIRTNALHYEGIWVLKQRADRLQKLHYTGVGEIVC